jgi:hypothetical protein
MSNLYLVEDELDKIRLEICEETKHLSREEFLEYYKKTRRKNS